MSHTRLWFHLAMAIQKVYNSALNNRLKYRHADEHEIYLKCAASLMQSVVGESKL